MHRTGALGRSSPEAARGSMHGFSQPLTHRGSVARERTVVRQPTASAACFGLALRASTSVQPSFAGLAFRCCPPQGSAERRVIDRLQLRVRCHRVLARAWSVNCVHRRLAPHEAPDHLVVQSICATRRSAACIRCGLVCGGARGRSSAYEGKVPLL